MEIAIIGAGAIGCTLAAYLKKEGISAHLVGRKKQSDVISKQGLKIKNETSQFEISIPIQDQLNFTPDLVIYAVKSQDLEMAILSTRQKIRKNTPVLLIQNGVRSYHFASQLLPSTDIINGVILFNAGYYKEGEIELADKRPIVLGKMSDFEESPSVYDNSTIGILEQILSPNFQVIISPNIEQDLWTKLLINIYANTMEGLTGKQLDTCMKNSDLRRISLKILKEAWQIIKIKHKKLSPLPNFPVSKLKLSLFLPGFLADWVFKHYLTPKGYGSKHTSTLQSIFRKKRTETEFINGEIVKVGIDEGISTPLNSQIVQLMQSIEDGHKFFTVSELKSIFS